MPDNNGKESGAELDLSLINSRQLASVPDAPDALTTDEKRQVELQRLRAELEGIRQDIDERKKYAGRIFWMSASWLAAIFIILVGAGIGSRFRFSDSVLLAAIGSTTANVLGLFYIVTKYLFRQK